MPGMSVSVSVGLASSLSMHNPAGLLLSTGMHAYGEESGSATVGFVSHPADTPQWPAGGAARQSLGGALGAAAAGTARTGQVEQRYFRPVEMAGEPSRRAMRIANSMMRTDVAQPHSHQAGCVHCVFTRADDSVRLALMVATTVTAAPVSTAPPTVAAYPKCNVMLVPVQGKHGSFVGGLLVLLGVIGCFVNLLGGLVLIGFGTQDATPHELTGKVAPRETSQRVVAIVMAIVTAYVVIQFVVIVVSHLQ
jgi:hypothetical protein